jgi:hypothetical protein
MKEQKYTENYTIRSLVICKHSSTNIISATESRRMRWAEHVACMGKINSYNILVRISEWEEAPERHRNG